MDMGLCRIVEATRNLEDHTYQLGITNRVFVNKPMIRLHLHTYGGDLRVVEAVLRLFGLMRWETLRGQFAYFRLRWGGWSLGPDADSMYTYYSPIDPRVHVDELEEIYAGHKP